MSIAVLLIMVLFMVAAQRLLYAKLWDKRLDMRLSFSKPEASEGDWLELTLELTNAKILPLPCIRAKFQTSRHLHFPQRTDSSVSDLYTQNNIFSIGAYQRIIRKQTFLCARRGHYRILTLNLIGTDLFLVSSPIRHLSCGAELTVLPRILSFDDMKIPFQQLSRDIETRSFINPDPFAFRGIREYECHDNFRQINFRASARTGTLMVNLYNAMVSREVVILLNLEPYGDWARDDVYEDSISLTASTALRLAGEGISVALISNGRDAVSNNPVETLSGTGRAHAHNILRQLARIDLHSAPEPMCRGMDGLERTEPVYFLISPYHGADFVAAYRRMQDRGLLTRWILPTLPDSIIRVDASVHYTRWEVEPHDMVKTIRGDTPT